MIRLATWIISAKGLSFPSYFVQCLRIRGKKGKEGSHGKILLAIERGDRLMLLSSSSSVSQLHFSSMCRRLWIIRDEAAGRTGWIRCTSLTITEVFVHKSAKFHHSRLTHLSHTSHQLSYYHQYLIQLNYKQKIQKKTI